MLSSIMFLQNFAGVAQLVEQCFRKAEVASSTLASGSRVIDTFRVADMVEFMSVVRQISRVD